MDVKVSFLMKKGSAITRRMMLIDDNFLDYLKVRSKFVKDHAFQERQHN